MCTTVSAEDSEKAAEQPGNEGDHMVLVVILENRYAKEKTAKKVTFLLCVPFLKELVTEAVNKPVRVDFVFFARLVEDVPLQGDLFADKRLC